MRQRLITVFLIPLIAILAVLGGAYAWTAARSIQQQFTNQQLSDLSTFLTSARQALRDGSPAIVESEMLRYSELYGSSVAVIDDAGELWATGGPISEELRESSDEGIDLALSGRRAEPTAAVMPWSFGESVLVEPILDDGRVIGAVLIAANIEAPRGQIVMHWTVLLLISAVVIGLLIFAVLRLTNWVLKPMLRVDQAMAAIERGEMEARIDDDTGPPEMRHMIRIFNGMADQIERVVSRQQEFAMNASHELRNPLGALMLRVESLATGLDETWEGDIEQTREEGRRMAMILDTLLAMARSQRTDSSFAPVDLTELVAQRIEAWQAVSDEAAVSFAGPASRRVPSVTDRTAVESAFDAVVDNAIKFSPAGSTIDVTVEEADGVCRICVRDHGPGLSADEVERVTSRFWRSPRDQNVPGSGLGLAVATDLMQSVGGTVEVLQAAGGGLMVVLQLPLQLEREGRA